MEKKELLQIWKKTEHEKKLKKDALNSDLRISSIAKIQLKETIFSISKEDILNVNNYFELLEKIDIKIMELAYKIEPIKFDLRGIDDEIIKTLLLPIKVVYFTSLFENAVSIGDVDKEFDCNNNQNKLKYIEELKYYYNEMGNLQMIDLINEGQKAKKENEFHKIFDKYELLENDNQEKKLDYIKRNIEIFALK
jgi:Asp-tRNA(Asn)/Glu-tRNA(Gln) amidotransferase C subunit